MINEALPDTTGWTFEQRVEWLRNCTRPQWESICKGCGVCCLYKFSVETLMRNTVVYSNCACLHLDTKTKKCNVYYRRFSACPDCKKIDLKLLLSPDNPAPDSCGYMEFLYGPAKYPAVVDWARVKNIPDNLIDWDMAKNALIPQSVKWCQKHK